jgi:hypothetical protein
VLCRRIVEQHVGAAPGVDTARGMSDPDAAAAPPQEA